MLLVFSLYLFIAWRVRVKDTQGFYGPEDVPAYANGTATAADWMSASYFRSRSFRLWVMREVLFDGLTEDLFISTCLAPYLKNLAIYGT